MKCRLFTWLLCCAILAGCATAGGNPKDPIEGYNRGMFKVNDALDRAILKPAAKAYDWVLPQPVKTGVANFFGNIEDVPIAVNNLLEGKGKEAASDVGRVLINTTVGIFGLIDWASDLGLTKHDSDFGITLGHWGVGPGAYFVVPFYGPRTVRDTFGLGFDIYADPLGYYPDVRVRNSLVALRFVEIRAALLPADQLIESAATDRYAYIRDAYLQMRRSKVYDGNPPREKREDDE